MAGQGYGRCEWTGRGQLAPWMRVGMKAVGGCMYCAARTVRPDCQSTWLASNFSGDDAQLQLARFAEKLRVRSTNAGSTPASAAWRANGSILLRVDPCWMPGSSGADPAAYFPETSLKNFHASTVCTVCTVPQRSLVHTHTPTELIWPAGLCPSSEVRLASLRLCCGTNPPMADDEPTTLPFGEVFAQYLKGSIGCGLDQRPSQQD